MPLMGTIPTLSLTRPTASVSLTGTKYQVLIILKSFPSNLNCPRTSNDQTYLHSYSSYSSQPVQAPSDIPRNQTTLDHPRRFPTSKHPQAPLFMSCCLLASIWWSLGIWTSKPLILCFLFSPVQLVWQFLMLFFYKNVTIELVSKYQDK